MSKPAYLVLGSALTAALMLSLGLLLRAQVPAQEPAQEPTRPARPARPGRSPEAIPALLPSLGEMRLASARRIYDSLTRKRQNTTEPSDVEEIATWSTRVLESERALAKGPAEQLQAIQAHLARMKQLEKEQAPTQGRPQDLDKARYHRVLAELILKEFRDTHPDGAPAAPQAPQQPAPTQPEEKARVVPLSNQS